MSMAGLLVRDPLTSECCNSSRGQKNSGQNLETSEEQHRAQLETPPDSGEGISPGGRKGSREFHKRQNQVFGICNLCHSLWSYPTNSILPLGKLKWNWEQ